MVVVVIAMITMAFALDVPDESAGDQLVTRIEPTPTPLPTPTPTPEPVQLEPSLRAAPVEPEAADDEALAATGPAPIVDADFVPGFVTGDLSDTGAAVSRPLGGHATAPSSEPEPEPEADAPYAEPEPAAPTPAPQPAADPTPVPTATPTEVIGDGTEPSGPGGDDGRPEPGPDGRPTAEQWAQLRACESGGVYTIDSGNGYYGAYQFSQATWDWIASMVRPGLVGTVPSEATPDQQDLMAVTLYDLRGSAPWPTCGRHLP